MTKLSVNLNKVALIRNSRGADYPNLVNVALDCERFGADGITIHPRPDERHAKYMDVATLKAAIHSELNIEGYPDKKFIETILNNRPHQVTLVPDEPGQLTSDHGWNTIKQESFLKDVIQTLKTSGARVSLFCDPDNKMVDGAKSCGADRIELYTGPYSWNYGKHRESAIQDYVTAAKHAHAIGLGINAGHDLNLENLKYFKENIPFLDEVSIGHALICDAIYLGLENTIRMYQKLLNDVL
ncbi:MAG: pyridoxine 5'-phosphate synthase [Chitinophagales bacterium]|nr:pyridoxine 5'-phosphate synthase [Chitinophagales bacterium]